MSEQLEIYMNFDEELITKLKKKCARSLALIKKK
jgi:hypothetical protein